MKTKLLLISLFFYSIGFSQNITSFTSDPDTNFTILTSASAIDQSSTGMNATWTFSNLTPVGTNIDTYAAPTAGQLSTYPGTTEVLSITTQGSMPIVSDFFLREDGSGTFITGVSQDDINLNYNSDNAFIGLFPLSFETTSSDPVAGTFTFEANNGTFTGTVTTNVDAYGVLNVTDNTGASYSGNVTRLRIDQTLSFSSGPFSNIGTLTQIVYYYYDNATNNIAFKYNFTNINSSFLNIDETTETLEVNSSLTTLSNNDFDTLELVKLYPNPAQDYIFISAMNKKIIESVSIIDLNGRTLTRNTQNISRISIQDLPQGLYFMSITSNSGQSVTKKFMKN